MRSIPDDVGTYPDRAQSPFARPGFSSLDQKAAYTGTAMHRIHHQAGNFRPGIVYERANFTQFYPAHYISIACHGHERGLLWISFDSVEPLADLRRRGGITQLASQTCECLNIAFACRAHFNRCSRLLQVVFSESMRIVTGPSLTSSTCMCAWNTPVSTLTPSKRIDRTNSW